MITILNSNLNLTDWKSKMTSRNKIDSVLGLKLENYSLIHITCDLFCSFCFSAYTSVSWTIRTGRGWFEQDCRIKKWNPFSLRSKEGRFLSIVLFSKESKMNWVREIKRSIISLQELCLHICSLAPSDFSIFGQYIFFNFATNFFPSRDFLTRWISVAAQVDFIPENYHEDQVWPQMTWHWNCWNCENCENCCKHNKKGGNHKTAKSSFGSKTINLTKL